MFCVLFLTSLLSGIIHSVRNYPPFQPQYFSSNQKTAAPAVTTLQTPRRCHHSVNELVTVSFSFLFRQKQRSPSHIASSSGQTVHATFPYVFLTTQEVIQVRFILKLLRAHQLFTIRTICDSMAWLSVLRYTHLNPCTFLGNILSSWSTPLLLFLRFFCFGLLPYKLLPDFGFPMLSLLFLRFTPILSSRLTDL